MWYTRVCHFGGWVLEDFALHEGLLLKFCLTKGSLFSLKSALQQGPFLLKFEVSPLKNACFSDSNGGRSPLSILRSETIPATVVQLLMGIIIWHNLWFGNESCVWIFWVIFQPPVQSQPPVTARSSNPVWRERMSKRVKTRHSALCVCPAPQSMVKHLFGWWMFSDRRVKKEPETRHCGASWLWLWCFDFCFR